MFTFRTPGPSIMCNLINGNCLTKFETVGILKVKSGHIVMMGRLRTLAAMWQGKRGIEETGVLTSLDFKEYRFCNVKTLSDPPSAWYVFLKHWKNCRIPCENFWVST